MNAKRRNWLMIKWLSIGWWLTDDWLVVSWMIIKWTDGWMMISWWSTGTHHANVIMEYQQCLLDWYHGWLLDHDTCCHCEIYRRKFVGTKEEKCFCQATTTQMDLNNRKYASISFYLNWIDLGTCNQCKSLNRIWW